MELSREAGPDGGGGERKPFDYEVAFGVARAVVVANLRLAEVIPLDPTDLMHELAEELWRVHDKFDPARWGGASYGTFAGGVAHRRLIDRARRAATRSASERGTGGEEGEGGSDLVTLSACHRATVSCFFTGACDEMLLRIPARLQGRWGRLGHPPRAYAAALLYREERGLSWRSLWRMLGADGSLRMSLGFSTVPSARRLIAAKLRLARWAKRQAL